MQRADQTVQDSSDITVAEFARDGVPFVVQNSPSQDGRKGWPTPIAVLVRALHAWWQRQVRRRELAETRSRDLSDPTVQSSPIIDECCAKTRSERPNPGQCAAADGAKRVADSPWILF
jgi:hypothetical protein